MEAVPRRSIRQGALKPRPLPPVNLKNVELKSTHRHLYLACAAGLALRRSRTAPPAELGWGILRLFVCLPFILLHFRRLPSSIGLCRSHRCRRCGMGGSRGLLLHGVDLCGMCDGLLSEWSLRPARCLFSTRKREFDLHRFVSSAVRFRMLLRGQVRSRWGMLPGRQRPGRRLLLLGNSGGIAVPLRLLQKLTMRGAARMLWRQGGPQDHAPRGAAALLGKLFTVLARLLRHRLPGHRVPVRLCLCMRTVHSRVFRAAERSRPDE